jgi:hypothetical protein
MTGSTTLTTLPSINARLEPRIVAARIQPVERAPWGSRDTAVFAMAGSHGGGQNATS